MSSYLDFWIDFIYIPLCIYFNRMVKLIHGHLIQIYIPLCIYFNFSSRTAPCLTKHIYIPLCIYFNSKAESEAVPDCSFTFHYVSISTYFFCSSVVSCHNLHSTMYLFQQLHCEDTKGGAYKFTFHYVSISTSLGITPLGCPSLFTFHYVSISTRKEVNMIVYYKLIYIPLCIYFNDRPQG